MISDGRRAGKNAAIRWEGTLAPTGVKIARKRESCREHRGLSVWRMTENWGCGMGGKKLAMHIYEVVIMEFSEN